MIDLALLQEEREFESLREAKARTAEIEQQIAPLDGVVGRSFIDQTLIPFIDAIASDRRNLCDGKSRLNGYALPLLALSDPILALLGLRTIFGRVAMGDPDEPPGYDDLADTIARSCYWEWKRRVARATRRGKPDGELPSLETVLAGRHQNQGASSGRVRAKVAKFEAAGAQASEWRALGGRLLDLARDEGFITVVKYPHNGNLIARVQLSEFVHRTLARTGTSTARLLVSPRFLPMLVPPRPWQSTDAGGFLTSLDPETAHLVKHRGNKKHLAALKEAAEQDGLVPVYQAVNALQETPWRVNAAVYAVLRYAWDNGIELPGLSGSTSLTEVEAALVDELDEERARLLARKAELKRQRKRIGTRSAPDAEQPELALLQKEEDALEAEWGHYHARRKLLRKPRKEKARSASRRSKLSLLMAICAHLESDAARLGVPLAALTFYFPYQLDYRGRVYSMVENLSPQGNDHARALLEFADGKPLGERGRFWLSVHVANTYGYDKARLDDRAEWTARNGDRIRELAGMVRVDGVADAARIRELSSEARGFWEKADRKKRWQFLAACIEWTRSDEPGFASHLPIALDASASGLQHLSALLRDEEGAYATNLTAAESPQDIYGLVADRLRSVVAGAANAGNAHAHAWLRNGTIDRGIVKRGVMTTPYGVTDTGLRDQLKKYVEDSGAQLDDSNGAIRYLVEELKKCIDFEVPSARLVMDWLKEAADLCAKFGCGLAWVTPAGFPVVVEHHHCHDGDPIRIRWTEPSGKRREYRLINRVAQDVLGVDAEEQKRTITPNFVHSLDAAHLMLTVARLRGEGLRHFAVIHDSYGVHAIDVDEMLLSLREEFIAMYEAEPLLLDRFIDAQIDRPGTPTGLKEQLRALQAGRPKLGAFVLSDVREAVYMFS